MGIAVLLLTISSAAAAGGSWLEPTGVPVEPGESISLSGDVSTGQLGWVEDGPYFAYLHGDEYGTIISEGLGGLETDVPLGRLEINASGNRAQVSIEFVLPNDTPNGEYWVTACNTPCRTGFGDLIGSTLFVGTDPPAVDEGSVQRDALNPAAASSGNASTAVVIAEDAGPRSEQAPTSMALARQPARAAGLDAAWVAISAGLALVVLLLASMVRLKAD